MAEIKTLIEGKELKYKGLIDIKQLYSTIDQWFNKHRYDKKEVKNYEFVDEDSKQIELELRPYKKITDYAKYEIRIEARFTNLKEVEVETKNKIKQKLWKGQVLMRFTAFFITDYENAWETKPFYYFVRTLVDKFVYRMYTSKMEDVLVSECNESFEEIRSFLNMHRYS
jgi:hypothetical protein